MAQSAREEAERLVATVLAVAARTGVVRDPDPRLAERLATGAGELATGVAGMLRALSTMAAGATQPSRPRPANPPHPDAWSAATGAPPDDSEPDDPEPDDSEPGADEAGESEPWSTATRESNRAAEAAAEAAREARRAARLAEEAARRAQEKAEEARRAASTAGRQFDVWAAATEPIPNADRRLAGTTNVDHDDAGPAAGADD